MIQGCYCSCHQRQAQPGYYIFIHGRPDPIHVAGAVGHTYDSKNPEQTHLVLWDTGANIIGSFDFTKCVVGFMRIDEPKQEVQEQ